MARKNSNPEEKRRYMLDTPIPKLVMRMAIPTIAAMLVTSIYNLADTFFVSHLGTSATGAVGVNSSIDTMIMMTGSLLASGAASFNARLLGANRTQHAREVLSTCFFTALLFGTALMIFGMIFTDPLLLFLGANEEILPYSEQYCRYILLAAPFMATSFVLNQCLRAEGSAIYSMVGMVSGAILNIGLDPLFIFTFGWGVAGASAATAISKLVSWTILMLPYLRKQTVLTIKLSQFKLRWGDFKEVVSMGSAAFLRGGLTTLSSILLNRIAVTFGTSALAAISVSNRINMIMVSACLGFGQGFQPVAGYSWGAERYDRVRGSFNFASRAAVLGVSMIALAMGIFARPLLLLFTENDAELVRIGMFSLRCHCLAMPIGAYCIIVNMLCAGVGRPIPTMLLGASRQGFVLPLLPVVVPLLGVWGVASVQSIGGVLNLALAVPISMRVTRDTARREAAQKVALPAETAVS